MAIRFGSGNWPGLEQCPWSMRLSRPSERRNLPLQGWDLPEEFATLRRLMEVRMNRQGRREYAQVLRLLEVFDLADVRAAVL